MRKLLFTFFGLILCTALGWGAVTTDVYAVGDTATKYSWTTTPAHPDLYLGANITINATHDGAASVTNGTYSSSQWYVYMADNSGKFSISAKEGYWIQSIAINNNAQNGAVIKKVGTSDVIANDETPYSVNSQSISLYVDETTSTTKAKNARIKKFTVTYDLAPTGVSLNVPAAMNATVGNKFQIIATVAPSTTVFQAVKWTTNNAAAVDVDQNGIIDVKGAGQATITATTVNGKTATCVIDAAATTDESFTEDYDGFGTWTGTGKQTKTGKYSLGWIFRNSKLDGTTLLETGVQGVQLQSGNNFIAYDNATSMEGGVKRVAFQWRAETASDSVVFDVDDANNTFTKYNTKLAANSDYANPQMFARDIAYNANAFFRIRIASTNSSKVVFGPLTITPYLLYKTKTVTTTGGYYEQNSTDLINNTGETVSFTLENNDGVASMDANGKVTALKDGEVIMKASWNEGKVWTTCTLTVKTVEPEASFAKTVEVKNYGDAAFTNTFTPTKTGGGAVSYKSSDETVAKVDASSGEVTIVNGGSAKITATIAAAAPYVQKEFTYTVDVRRTPATGEYWAESFADAGEVTSNATKTIKGDDDIENKWTLTNFMRHPSQDLLTYQDENVQGVRIRYSGSITNGVPFDGGIKAIAFDWRVLNNALYTHFTVKAGDVPHDFTHDCSPTAATVIPYYHEFNAKHATKLTISNAAQEDPQQAYPIIGPITVVPYLYYADKDVEIRKEEDPTYTAPIINNTGADLTYSIECEEGVATINSSTGEVTVGNGGEATVTATWTVSADPEEKVTTSYHLTMHAKPAPTVSFADGNTVEKSMNVETYTNALNWTSDPTKCGAVTYESDNEEIAKFEDETVNVLSIVGAGDVHITAHIGEGDDYSALDVTYTLTVTDPQEDAMEEKFKDIKLSSVSTQTVEGDLFDWDFKSIRRDWEASNPDKLRSDAHAARLQNIGETTESYIRSNAVVEGGIKRVSFKWNKESPGTCLMQFNVSAGSKVDNVSKSLDAGSGGRLAAEDVTYNHNFFVKQNVVLSIDNNCAFYPLIGDITITPYLLYTREAKTIYAKDCEGYKYDTKNDFIYNNTEGQGAISYAISGENVADIAEMDETTGIITIKGEGTVKVTATWEEVETSYDLTIQLEDPALAFDPATPSTTATQLTYKHEGLSNPGSVNVTYSIESGTAGTTSIDDDGTVHFTETGELTIKASAVQQLPYRAGNATYTLTINRAALPEALVFTTSTYSDITMNTEPFTNTLANVPASGVGAVTYSSDNKRVADVNETSGLVTIYGPGDVTIKGTVADGPVYAGSYAQYTLKVADPEEEYFEEAFTDKTWELPVTEVVGDNGTWTNYYARRKTSDYMQTEDKPAVWFSGSGEYIPTYIISPTLEGGIKRVSFEWYKYDMDNPAFEVTVDNQNPDVVAATAKTFTTYNHNFGVKHNTTLKIANTTASAWKIGTIKITPYLFYKTKEVEIWKNVNPTYTNESLINNTGADPTYSIECEEGVATINSTTGEVTVGNGGEATVTATWTVSADPEEKVTTSYHLTMHAKSAPIVSFADGEEVEKSMNVETYTNALNWTSDPSKCGAVTYESDNEAVAKFDDQTVNEVSIVGKGTATITAHIAAGKFYSALDLSYTLSTTDPGETGREETFPDYEGSPWLTDVVTTEQTIKGALCDWKVNYARHKSDDGWKGGPRAVMLNNEGTPYMYTAVEQEGGIKRVSFLWWKNTAQNPTFSVSADDKTYTIENAVIGVPTEFNRNFFIKNNNATLRIDNGVESRMYVGPVTITPYLLYTTKTVELQAKDYAVDSKYTNSAIINNTGVTIEAGQTDIVFSIKDQSAETDKIAVIDAETGEVTVKGLGKVTVQTTWEDVVTSYELTIAMPAPVISGLDATAIDLDGGSYTPSITVTIGDVTLQEPELTYSSSNTNVAVVNNGTYAPVSVGTSNMKVTLTAGTYNGYPYASVNTGNKKLTVNGYTPAEGKFFNETFTSLNAGEKLDTTIQGDNKVYGWNVHNFNKSGDIIIKNTADNEGYIAMNGAQEGGIKYVSFGWATEDPENDKAVGFVIRMNEEPYTYHYSSASKAEGYTFGRMFNQKTNSAFSITVEEGSTKNIVVKSPVTVVPYLLYTTKEDKLNMNLSTTYKNEDLIDNRDDATAIEYKSGDESIATVADDGTVTAVAPGKVTITAQWGDVTTSYQLTIIAGKTTITLSDNYEGGSEQVIENTINAQMEAEVVIPTRTGYRFNAYFYDAAAAKGGNRMTATSASGVTSWVNAVRTYNDVAYINNRVWVYEGAECTIYANWMPERKIALDNQDEMTPDTVYTAICANNDAVNLLTPVAVPVKADHSFLGYYTAAEGGIQIVDASGSFKASVEGYTDAKTKWQKNEEITNLYAHWVPNVITLDESKNNSAIIAQVAEAGLPTTVKTTRTIKAGMYNTFCLPFDVDADMMAEKFGSDYNLQEFTGAKFNGDSTEVTINFTKVNAMVAGKPYLIKTSVKVENPSFSGVTIVNSADTTFGEGIVMRAIMNPTHITPGDHTHMIVIADDQLAWLQEGDGSKMNGMRAYFHVENAQMQAALRNAAPRLNVNTTDTPTELMQNAECTMQDVQKVIINNQLVIIREGVKFNAMGAKL